jgi:hypothetical protein
MFNVVTAASRLRLCVCVSGFCALRRASTEPNHAFV